MQHPLPPPPPPKFLRCIVLDHLWPVWNCRIFLRLRRKRQFSCKMYLICSDLDCLGRFCWIQEFSDILYTQSVHMRSACPPPPPPRIFIGLECCGHISGNVPHVKLNENPFIGRRVAARGWTDGQNQTNSCVMQLSNTPKTALLRPFLYGCLIWQCGASWCGYTLTTSPSVPPDVANDKHFGLVRIGQMRH